MHCIGDDRVRFLTCAVNSNAENGIMRYLGVVVAVCLVGCAPGSDTDESNEIPAATENAIDPAPMAPAAGATATAHVRDSSGNELGTLTLVEEGAGIAVSGTLRGLPPGTHAIHIHAVGQCAPPFQSSGGHWNPTNRQHGTANAQGPHLGDLPNFTVLADGTADVRATTPGGSLQGMNALLDADGAAVVVHADADDNRTDPAGNAGARIACGVVQAS